VASPRAQTRGFLFADLRGYSAFTEAHGDRAAAELIGRYRALVREEIRTHDGAEIRTEGDSFYIVFDSVSDAVRAALAIRDSANATTDTPSAYPIAVGIGLHAGEVEDDAQGIVSSAVNIAARVCAVAGPGEVLVTDTVRALTRGYLPVGYVPRGSRRLKGISEPVRLFRVTRETGHTERSTRIATRPRLAVVGAVAAVVVAGAAGASFLGGRARESSSPSPSFAVIESLAAPPVSISSAPADPPPFPDTDEAALLTRLADSVTRTCDRAEPKDLPVYERTITYAGRSTQFIDVPLGVYGGITCLVDGNRALYWRSIGAGNIDAVFSYQTVRLKIPRGTCSDLGGRAWETWETGLHHGELMCYRTADGTAVLEWTWDDEPIYAVATRLDGNASALFSWWLEDGRLLGR
jgi:class 3 adenylate cyclase